MAHRRFIFGVHIRTLPPAAVKGLRSNRGHGHGKPGPPFPHARESHAPHAFISHKRQAAALHPAHRAIQDPARKKKEKTHPRDQPLI